jgi:hypothetical protein
VRALDHSSPQAIEWLIFLRYRSCGGAVSDVTAAIEPRAIDWMRFASERGFFAPA